MPADRKPHSAEADLAGSSTAPMEVLTGYSLHEPNPSFWLNVVLGISLFGAPWPFFRFILNLLHSTGSDSLWLLPVHEMFFAAVFSLLFGGTVCIFVLAMLGAGVATGLNLILQTMTVDSKQLMVGSIAGGIVGLILSMPSCLADQLPFTLADQPSHLECVLFISFATLLAQSGGTWGAWRVLYGSKSASTVVAELPKSMRFGVRHLLLLSIWCAVVLTTLKYLGVLSERLMGLVGIWLVLQAILVLLAIVFATRLRRNCVDLQEGSFEQ